MTEHKMTNDNEKKNQNKMTNDNEIKNQNKMINEHRKIKKSKTSNGSILQNTFVVITIALICDLLWGSAFPCIKLGYDIYGIGAGESANQILFAGIRFILAGLMVIIFLCIKEKRIVYPRSIQSLQRVMTLSLFQTILQYIFFYLGLARTTGVKGSVIEASNVFVAIFVSSVIFRQEKLSFPKILGSLIGFVGVVIINLNGLTLDFGIGDGMIMFSTVAYAMSSVLLKKYAKDENTVMLSGYQFLFGGIVMSIMAIVMGGRIDIRNAAVGILLYLAFISAMAYSLWSIILAHNPVSKVAVLGFMNPVFGVILSALMLGEVEEAFGIKSLLALVCVSVGVWIVYRKKKD